MALHLTTVTRICGPRVKATCRWCGGEAVKCDAWAEWSLAEQAWIVTDVDTRGWCEDCRGETRIDLKLAEAAQ